MTNGCRHGLELDRKTSPMNEKKAALFSNWTPRVALFSGALICMSILLHRLLGMPTPLALNLFVVAFALAGLAILLGGIALADVWKRGAEGAPWAMIGMLIAGGIFIWPLSFLPSYLELPVMYDATTDVQAPPRFVALAKERVPGSNPIEYPARRFAELQKATYPDLRPLYVNRGLDDTFELVLDTVKRMRFHIVAEAAPRPRQAGTIEAVDRTTVIGFYDDVVIRVDSDQGRSRVDVRSSSRYGLHDMGRNASRVRRVLTEIQTRVDASISGPNVRFARIKARLDKGKALTKRGKAGSQKSADRRTSQVGAQSGAQRAPVPKVKPPVRAGNRSRDIQD